MVNPVDKTVAHVNCERCKLITLDTNHRVGYLELNDEEYSYHLLFFL